MMDGDEIVVILPIAVVTGRIRIRGGYPESELVSVAMASLLAPGFGKVGERDYPFPPAMASELVFRGVSRGLATISMDGGIELLDQGRHGGEDLHLDTAWAVDLVQGNTHPFGWVLRCERDSGVTGTREVLLNPTLDARKSIDSLRQTDLRRLVRDMSSIRQALPASIRAGGWRGMVDRADHVEGLGLAREMQVAIPVRRHKKGTVEQWVVGAETPPSIMTCLRQSIPTLFELKVETRELRLGFAPSRILQLLDNIDEFWEECKWNLFQHTPKQTRHLLAKRGITTVATWRTDWAEQPEPCSDIEMLDTVIGPAEEQGKALQAICAKVNHRLVLLTSFLNPKSADWLATLLNTVPDETEVLVLYGHANDEDAETRATTARIYETSLGEHLRAGVKLSVRPTTQRSHEKVVVTDTAWFMLGSWNAGSSSPYSTYVEGSFIGQSGHISSDLLDLLSEEVDDNSKSFLQNLRASLPRTIGSSGVPILPRLEALEALFRSIIEQGVHEVRDWRKVREQLTALRDVVWTHFASPKVELVRGEDIRDVLVEQSASATRSILITTDRVNEAGLDASLAKTLRPDELHVRILWGMEDPAWKIASDDPASEELKIAGEIMRRFVSAYPDSLRSSDQPMGNHSKIIVVDEGRLLVGSDNLLAHGRERGEESSREVAILVEHPLLARRVLGSLLLERPALWFPFNLKSRERPWELFELLRKQIESLATSRDVSNPHNPDILRFAVESTFYEFTPNGEILKDGSGNPLSTNSKLAERWEQVLQAFGKGRSPRLYFEELCKEAHEEGFLQLVRGRDTRYSLFPLGSQPPLAPRVTIERDPNGPGVAMQEFLKVMERLEREPFAFVSEETVLQEAKQASPRFDPSRWEMDDEGFLDLLRESARIDRGPNGSCRRIRESERGEFREREWDPSLVGPPNARCTECGKSFHHPHFRERASGESRPLPKGLCLDCRAQVEASKRGLNLISQHRQPIVVRDKENPNRGASHPGPVAPAPLPNGRFASRCSICGAPTEVPFPPDGVRPVFCRTHYSMRERSAKSTPPERRSPRQLYDTICSWCGKKTKVPFLPQPGRPVYCPDHRIPETRRKSLED